MTGKTTQVDAITDAADQVLPVEVLHHLACRFNHSGMFLMTVRSDGKVAYWDESAPPFFLRYVLPALQSGVVKPCPAEWANELAASGGIHMSGAIPGVTLAVLPHVEKRRLRGLIALAGRSECFALNEDVLRVCSSVGVDAAWLQQQAGSLPATDADLMQRQARLLISMVRDQVRLSAMEGEIDSLSAQLAKTYEELTLIHSISGGMRINRGVSDFFKQVCLDLLQVTPIRGLGVYLEQANTELQDPHMFGPLNLPLEALRRLAEQVLERIREHPGPLLIDNISADSRFNWLEPYANQLLALPLQRQEQVLGCLFALDKIDGEFDSTDSKLLNAIGNQCAVYMQNAMLFEDVHGLMMGLLHSLTSAVDAKDRYTCGHSERVAMLARELSNEAGLAASVVERVYIAGLLHDVGKIGVPESVLCKTGRLTSNEFAIMKRHPQIGARILRNIKQVEDILPGVLYHHERYDGKGYPAGLAGQSIPLMGRILCLADSFDAMTSNRTYRRAMPLEVALAEIRRCAGTQFDPALAEAFLRIGADRLRELLEKHEERASAQMEEQVILVA
jgi:HD-GYP domain-containing protein (c-di-GMP phosphodiesterase class II)